MKVKIGNKIYNAEDEPIMIILNDGEKDQIANMPKGFFHYCQYPENIDKETIEKWMKENETIKKKN